MVRMKQLLDEYLVKITTIVQREELQPLENAFFQLSIQLMASQEVYMALYLAVTRFDGQRVFQTLLTRNNNFKDLKPDWYLMFNES